MDTAIKKDKRSRQRGANKEEQTGRQIKTKKIKLYPNSNNLLKKRL